MNHFLSIFDLLFAVCKDQWHAHAIQSPLHVIDVFILFSFCLFDWKRREIVNFIYINIIESLIGRISMHVSVRWPTLRFELRVLVKIGRKIAYISRHTYQSSTKYRSAWEQVRINLCFRSSSKLNTIWDIFNNYISIECILTNKWMNFAPYFLTDETLWIALNVRRKYVWLWVLWCENMALKFTESIPCVWKTHESWNSNRKFDSNSILFTTAQPWK